MKPLLSSAQHVRSDEPVTMKVVNEPLSAIMERITRNTGITFSYNPDQLQTSRTYTFNMVKRPLNEVLDLLFHDIGFDYRHSGTQIILFSVVSEHSKDQDENAADAGLSESKSGHPAVTDTVYMTQTLLKTDTLMIKETLVRFDTVYIIRKEVENRIGKGDIFSEIKPLGEEQTKHLKIYVGPTLGWLGSMSTYSASSKYESKLKDYRKFYNNKPLSGSIGMEVHASYSRYSVQSGLMLTGFAQNLDYKYEKSTGGFFVKDTLDAYYTLTEQDTNWFYIMDSTYIPVDLKQYGFKSNNRINYVEIPLSFQYSMPVAQMLLYFRAGLIAGVRAGGKGMYIYASDEGAGNIEELQLRSVVFSYQLGAGVMLPVHRKIIFNTGVNYRRQMQGIYKEFPIDIRFGAVGINAGLLFKF